MIIVSANLQLLASAPGKLTAISDLKINYTITKTLEIKKYHKTERV
jgi:hypothetical protein